MVECLALIDAEILLKLEKQKRLKQKAGNSSLKN